MKASRIFLVALVAVLLCCCGAVAFSAMAQTTPTPIQQTILTDDYVDLGQIHALSAWGDTVVVLQTQGEGATASVHLTYMGGVTHDVDLDALLSAYTDESLSLPDTPSQVQMALYDGTVLLHLGGTRLYAYTPRSGLQPTAVSTSYDVGVLGQYAMTSFAVDVDGTICVGYANIWHSVPFTALFDAHFGGTDAILSDLTRLDYRLTLMDGVCCFGYGDAYLVYDYVNGTVRIPLTSVSRYDAFSYGTSTLILRDSAVYALSATTPTQETSVIAHDDFAMGLQDDLLGQGTCLAATRRGEGTLLYVADNAQQAVKCYDSRYELVRMFGTYGISQGRLYSPTQVALDDMTAINDAGNNRVVVYREGHSYVLPIHAHSVATGEDKVYVASTVLGNTYLVNTYDFARPKDDMPYTLKTTYFEYNVDSVCCDGTNAYALSGGSIYRLDLEPVEIRYVSDASDMIAGKHEGVLYVHASDKLMLFKDGFAVGMQIELPAGILDYEADYCGNLYVLLDDGALYRYERLHDGYDRTQLGTTASIVDLAIDADGLVYGLYRHALVSLQLDVADRTDDAYDHPTDYQLWVGRVEQTIWAYGSPNNYESILHIAPCYALHLATITYRDVQFYYVELDDTRGTRAYVPTDVVTPLPDKDYTDDYCVRFDGVGTTTGIYRYPFYSSDQRMATVSTADAVFRVKRMLGMVDDHSVWPWYEIEYEGAVAYVMSAYYKEDKVVYPEIKRYYARCVASKLGTRINVYVAPDEDAEVFTTLVDGTKVEMPTPLDKDSEWTQVRINDGTYYVQTRRLTDSSLTNGQTFAILMTVVVVLAAVVTVLLYMLVHRRRT